LAAAVVVVVIVVGLEDLLAELLLPLVDICIELVAILSDRELLVIIDGNADLLRAYGLVLGVVKLTDIGMAQGLLCGVTLVGIELKKTLQEVQ
jgi:hypothetical protein